MNKVLVTGITGKSGLNLEAIACGTPVITYRTGGRPEVADVLLSLDNSNITHMASNNFESGNRFSCYSFLL